MDARFALGLTWYSVVKRYFDQRHTRAMLVPAWRLPASVVVLSLLAAVLLPGVAPGMFFGGMLIVWLSAAALFVMLRRREQSSQAS